MRAPVARLEPHVSAGHETTVEAEDTVGDIFVPYYCLWQIFRHGKNFVLKAGSEVPARTDATISAQPNGAIGDRDAPPAGAESGGSRRDLPGRAGRDSAAYGTTGSDA